MTNDDRSLERVARSWLEEGPTRAPDRPVNTALTRIQTTRQERDLWIPWRFPTMNPITRRAAIAVIGVIAVGGSLYLFGRGNGIGGPGATPTAAPTAAPSVAPKVAPSDLPLVPSSPLPDPSGDPVPADLLGRVYRVEPPEILNGRQLVLTLRPADDPHCAAMFEGRSTCFTVLWSPVKETNDPGVRGSARIVAGNLVLSFDLVPFDLPCVGSIATYAIEASGATLRGIDPPACTFSGFVELP